VPIDWFQPEYWNALTVGERADFMTGGIKVALPLAEHCDTWEKCREWKNLPEEQFMEKYGNVVLAQYEMPTDEEIEQFKRWMATKDDETDEEQEVTRMAQAE
jgi:hypothetical protein